GCQQGWPVRRRGGARGRGPVPAPGPGAGPQEARTDAAPDPAHPGRPCRLRADMGECLPERLQLAGRRGGADAGERLSVHGAVRRPPAEALSAERGETMKYERISADCHIDLPMLDPTIFTANATPALKERMPFVTDG